MFEVVTLKNGYYIYYPIIKSLWELSIPSAL